MLGLVVLSLFLSTTRSLTVKDFLKAISPLTAVVAGILSLSTMPPPFGLTVGILQLVSLGALALYVGLSYQSKPAA